MEFGRSGQDAKCGEHIERVGEWEMIWRERGEWWRQVRVSECEGVCVCGDEKCWRGCEESWRLEIEFYFLKNLDERVGGALECGVKSRRSEWLGEKLGACCASGGAVCDGEKWWGEMTEEVRGFNQNLFFRFKIYVTKFYDLKIVIVVQWIFNLSLNYFISVFQTLKIFSSKMGPVSRNPFF